MAPVVGEIDTAIQSGRVSLIYLRALQSVQEMTPSILKEMLILQVNCALTCT